MSVEPVSEFLRARVSKQTKAAFDDICTELGKSATEQLRELIENFVAREYGRLSDRIVVHIYRPAGYQFGAWRVTIKLRNPAEMIWANTPIPFRLPDLPQRRLASDPEYRAVVSDPSTKEPTLGGQFKDGEWRGHLYSNGIYEGKNSMPIEKVRDELTLSIETLIKRFSAHEHHLA